MSVVVISFVQIVCIKNNGSSDCQRINEEIAVISNEGKAMKLKIASAVRIKSMHLKKQLLYHFLLNDLIRTFIIQQFVCIPI